MKSKILYPFMAALCLAALTAGGCSGKDTESTHVTSSVSQETASGHSAVPTSAVSPSASGEGAVPTDIPDANLRISRSLNEPCEFTVDGQPLYTVTISDVSFTERRAVVETEPTEKVLLITYAYETLTDEPALVDDMSFRCYINGSETPLPYYLADQLNPDLAEPGHAVTAEIAYSVSADTVKADIYLVNNANPEGECFVISVDLS